MSQATTENLNFCDALRAIKSGKRAQRAGWNGKGLFAFLQPGSVHGPYVGVPIAEDAAPDASVVIEGVSVSLFNTNAPEETAMRFPHVCLSYPTGTFVAWAPSQTDMLASDWRVEDLAKQEPAPAKEPGRRIGRISVAPSVSNRFIASEIRRCGGKVLDQFVSAHDNRVTLIVEHPDLELIPEGQITPTYIASANDRTRSIDFQKVTQ